VPTAKNQQHARARRVRVRSGAATIDGTRPRGLVTEQRGDEHPDADDDEPEHEQPEPHTAAAMVMKIATEAGMSHPPE